MDSLDSVIIIFHLLSFTTYCIVLRVTAIIFKPSFGYYMCIVANGFD